MMFHHCGQKNITSLPPWLVQGSLGYGFRVQASASYCVLLGNHAATEVAFVAGFGFMQGGQG